VGYSAPSLAVATCAPGTKAFRQFNPTLVTIDASSSDPSLFHLTNDNKANIQIQQVFTFTNIPATASGISLHWYISATVPEFSSDGSATGAVQLLDTSKLDLSAPVLTAAAVNAAIDTESGFPGGNVGGAGFGFWAGPDFPKPHEHAVSGTALPVRPTLSFKIAIRDGGDVVIRQTGQDGLYLSYDC
jgi:hypothetical protein